MDPAHQPAAVRFGLFLKLLQQLGGHWKVILKITFVSQGEFFGKEEIIQ